MRRAQPEPHARPATRKLCRMRVMHACGSKRQAAYLYRHTVPEHRAVFCVCRTRIDDGEAARRLAPHLAAHEAGAQGRLLRSSSAVAIGREEFVSAKLAPKLAQQLKVTLPFLCVHLDASVGGSQHAC